MLKFIKSVKCVTPSSLATMWRLQEIYKIFRLVKDKKRRMKTNNFEVKDISQERFIGWLFYYIEYLTGECNIRWWPTFKLNKGNFLVRVEKLSLDSLEIIIYDHNFTKYNSIIKVSEFENNVNFEITYPEEVSEFITKMIQVIILWFPSLKMVKQITVSKRGRTSKTRDQKLKLVNGFFEAQKRGINQDQYCASLKPDEYVASSTLRKYINEHRKGKLSN